MAVKSKKDKDAENGGNITPSKKSAKKGLHDDHRKRVREKFRDTGLTGFHEHNVLEFMLFYAIPRKDTNEIAHELINEFGSFAQVLNAPLEDLTKVDGVGLEAATFIKFIPELFRYYMANSVKDKRLVSSSKDAIDILSSYYLNCSEEKFVIMYLDAKSCLLKCKEISQGESAMVYTDFRSLIKTAISLGAEGVVISHCHSSGFSNPSSADKQLTEAFYKICSSFNIHLCDHIIFSENDVCAMSEMKGIKGVKFTF